MVGGLPIETVAVLAAIVAVGCTGMIHYLLTYGLADSKRAVENKARDR